MTTEFSTSFDEFAPEAATAVGPRFDIKRFLLLRGPLMMAIALLLGIPGVLAGWLLTPVVYTASADILFLASTPRVMYDDGSRALAGQYDRFRTTQTSMITGNTILSRVLDAPNIQALPAVAQAQDPLTLMRGALSTRVDRGSELVTVTCTLPDRDLAQQILEEVIAVYLEYALREEADAGGERLRVLRQERDARQIELELQLRQIAEIQGAVDIALGEGVSVETELYREGLVRAEEDLSGLESRILEIEELIKRIDTLREQCQTAPGQPIFEFGVEDRVGADPRVVTLRQDVVRAETSYAALRDRVVEGSPQLKAEQKNLVSLKSSLSQLERAVRLEALSALRAEQNLQMGTTAKQAEEAQQRAARFQTLLDEQNERVASAAGQVATLEEARAKADEVRNTLRNVRQQINEILLESNAPARVKLASPATVPPGPDHGRRMQVMALAVLASLGMGFAMGAWRELTDQQVRSPQDVSRMTRLPVIAAIPHATEEEALDAKRLPLLTADHPNSTSADEYRRVLARLLYPDNAAEVNTLLVVSPTRGDGKTALACNLAIALTQANRRVLLIDLSSRRPVIEDFFGLAVAPGLGEILHGERAAEELIRASAFKNLAVLGPGMSPHGLAGSLASREMLEFLEWAEEKFDHIILDTPPFLLMADAKLLAPVVDAVTVVVGAGVSTLGMVQRCLRDMEQADANVIGVVLNGIRRLRGGYLAHHLKLYYAYSAGNGNDGFDKSVPDALTRGGANETEPSIVLLPYESENDKERGKQV